MKKIIICMLTILTVLSICGCKCAPTTHWKPMQDKQNVKAIYLVMYEDFENYEIIKGYDLEILDNLCEDISSLVMTKAFAPPGGEPRGMGFLIEYLNGELDIISEDHPGIAYYSNGKLYWQVSLYYFDMKDFKNLINKYLPM